jgi:cardiolipin synthase
VDIILPGQNDDKDFILAMNRFSYNKLLNTHINVHEFDGFIHAKIIIVDETFVFITSANLDFRSL